MSDKPGEGAAGPSETGPPNYGRIMSDLTIRRIKETSINMRLLLRLLIY